MYSLLEGHQAAPVRLICAATTRAGDPWLLMERLKDADDVEEDEETAREALAGLARVHRRYYGRHRELADIPRWDATWLASQGASIYGICNG